MQRETVSQENKGKVWLTTSLPQRRNSQSLALKVKASFYPWERQSSSCPSAEIHCNTLRHQWFIHPTALSLDHGCTRIDNPCFTDLWGKISKKTNCSRKLSGFCKVTQWVSFRAGHRNPIFWFSSHHLRQVIVLLCLTQWFTIASLIQKAILWISGTYASILFDVCQLKQAQDPQYIWILINGYSIFLVLTEWLHFLLSQVLGCWHTMPQHSSPFAADSRFINTHLSERMWQDSSDWQKNLMEAELPQLSPVIQICLHSVKPQERGMKSSGSVEGILLTSVLIINSIMLN